MFYTLNKTDILSFKSINILIGKANKDIISYINLKKLYYLHSVFNTEFT